MNTSNLPAATVAPTRTAHPVPVAPDATAEIDGGRWIMHVPVVSTGHLRQATVATLAAGDSTSLYPGIWIIAFDEGLFVRADAESNPDLAGLPDDLATCIRWAWANGYVWLRFDPDGDVVPGLQHWRW